MFRFVLGIIVGIVFVAATVVLYAISGKAPVTTSDPPVPFENLIARTALHARISREMPTSVPIRTDEAVLLAGAGIYRKNCAMCHGLPNQTAPLVGTAMFPHAPQFFQPERKVTDKQAGEAFWKAKHGIRLSGMPGFGASLSDDEIWKASLLVANVNELPARVRQALATSSAPVDRPN